MSMSVEKATLLYPENGGATNILYTWYFIIFINIAKVAPTSRLLSRIVLCQLAQLT